MCSAVALADPIVLADPVVRLARTAEWSSPGAGDAVLDGPARERRDRLLVPADRGDFVAARVLAREALAQLVGCAVDDVVIRQRCDACSADGHGRPVVVKPEGAQVSWSHARGLVAVIASRYRVGIDVEWVRPLGTGVAEFALAPAERAAWIGGSPADHHVIGRWTRKEALVKVGAIQLDDFPRVDLGTEADDWDGWLLCGRSIHGSCAMLAVAFESVGDRERDGLGREAVQLAIANAAGALDGGGDRRSFGASQTHVGKDLVAAF